MSITNELRKWSAAYWGKRRGSTMEAELGKIADRIDEEHRSECELSFTRGFSDGSDMDGWSDGTMAEHGLVRLPVDVHGAPWRVGDWIGDSAGKPAYRVAGLQYDGERWTLFDQNWVLRFVPAEQCHARCSAAERIRAVVADMERAPYSVEGCDGIDSCCRKLRALADELDGEEA